MVTGETLVFISLFISDLEVNTFLISFAGTLRVSPEESFVIVTEFDVEGGLWSTSFALGLLIGRIVTLASVVGQNRFPILLSLTGGKLTDFFSGFLIGEELTFFLSVIKSSYLRWYRSLDGFKPDGLIDFGFDE